MLRTQPRAILAMPVGPEEERLRLAFERLGIEAYRPQHLEWAESMVHRSDTVAVVVDTRGHPDDRMVRLVSAVSSTAVPVGAIVGEPEQEDKYVEAGAAAIAAGTLTEAAACKVIRDLAWVPKLEEDLRIAPATARTPTSQIVKAQAPGRAGREDEPLPREALRERILWKRSKLKIYMGAAPGVGKTYAMLREAHDRRSRGDDVVVGIVETYGRSETAQQLERLPAIPRRAISYKGAIVPEMDLEAILERRPAIVLVDELAHTNAPGSLNRKRYEDIELIRVAGIEVLSTLNIQHLESLNNLIERITGVKVRETVPDHVLLDATEVVLVDLPPEDLQRRLETGKIYAPDKITQALGNFFTTHNLTALRELALRELADRVDLRLEEVRASLGRGEEAPGIQERVLACITTSPDAQRLIRRASRLASRLNAELIVLHVTGAWETARQAKALRDSMELAESLDGRAVTVQAEGSAAEAIANFANEWQSTLIVIGESKRSWFRKVFGTPVIDEILSRTTHIDVVIVATGGSAQEEDERD